jgi:hypothetical protein
VISQRLLAPHPLLLLRQLFVENQVVVLRYAQLRRR